MTKKILSLVFCALAVAYFREGEASAGASDSKLLAATQPPDAMESHFLPVLQVDLSDLDVRDAANNPVQTPQARGALTELFRQNLAALALLSAPHAMVQAEQILNSFLHLFNKLIFRHVPARWRARAEAFVTSKRRSVHNVHKLWISFAVGLFLNFLAARLLSLSRSPQRLSLRC